MNLTLYDLEQLKKGCKYITDLVDEIKAVYNPSDMQRKLFVSREDYNESLKIKNELPQDFYYFRLFDCFVQIVFHKQKKKYLIYIDGFYSKVLDNFERNQQNQKSYFISDDFNNTLEIFEDVVIDLMKQKIYHNELF